MNLAYPHSASSAGQGEKKKGKKREGGKGRAAADVLYVSPFISSGGVPDTEEKGRGERTAHFSLALLLLLRS